MEKVLSIIIPTYNMSQYIERCLNSLLSSATKDKLDIIVVNDGSKDDSSEKAKHVALSYPDTIRVIDKPNGNYGSCINTGLKLAIGKYIKILDADDQFDTSSLEKVIDLIEHVDVDLVLTDFKRNYEQAKTELVSFPLPPKKILPFTEICSIKEFKNLWMHSVMYKTALFHQIDYYQTEGISYTDQEWIFSPLAVVRKVYYIPEALYLYTLGREGQTVSESYMKRNFAQHVICIKSMINSFNQLPTDTPKAIKQMLYSRLFNLVRFVYKGYLIKRYKDKKGTLRDFDAFIETSLPKLHKDIAKLKLSKPVMPYHYIKHWQKNPRSRVLHYMINLYIWKKRLF